MHTRRFPPHFLLLCVIICLTSPLPAIGSSLDPSAFSAIAPDNLISEIASLQNWTTTHRRALHQMPELLFELHETSAYVQAVLASLSIPFTLCARGVGIVADIGTGRAPCVALRADMDALPISETADVDFKSQRSGKMHACGHDSHTAMLLAAARILKSHESSLRGTVRLLFQPAEEGGAGGLVMLKEGVLSRPPQVQMVYGQHIWPTLPSGIIASRSGAIFAAAGFFTVTLNGGGGHAAMPHNTKDTVLAVAHCVSMLQSIVSRSIDPVKEGGVVSVTKISGGNAYNVIPASASFGGTIRALSQEQYTRMEERLRSIVNGVAQASGLTATVRLSSFDDACTDNEEFKGELPGACTYPPMVNNAAAWQLAQSVAAGIVGAERVQEADATMGGEDFGYFMRNTPGVFVLIGSGNEQLGTTHGVHTPLFKLDETVMSTGTAMHVLFAKAALQQLGERLQNEL